MSVFSNDIMSYRDNIIVNEAYIGKTETLKKIEEKFHELRSEKINFYSNISQNPKIIEINRLFEKQFGMDIFALKVDKSEQINAYTKCIAINFDIANNVDLPMMVEGSIDKGFRWKANNNFCIIVHISYGLLVSNLTDEEVVAIIIHEIGHNFADALYDNINFANKDMMHAYEKYLTSYATLLGFLFSLSSYIQAKKELKRHQNSTNRIESRKVPGKLRGIMDSLKGKHADHRDYKREIRARKKGGTALRRSKRLAGQATKDLSRASLMRQNEVIADKFAGIYGYGVAISSSLDKMDRMKSKAQSELENRSQKLAAASRDYDNEVRNITDYDEHPHTVERIKEEIKLLEREISKDDIDPKVKEVLKSQLSDLNKLLDKITTTSNKLSKDENAQNEYNDYVRHNSPGAVSDEIEDKIEEALDRLLEEDKKKKINK